MKDYTNSLFKFIKNSPSAFHTVSSVKERLVADGYTELCEGSAWSLVDGGKYFVTRNGSSIIAFRKCEARGFVITASHSDSPAFRVKASGESALGTYTKLPVERYGGMILYSWFDRPLSIAGRVVVRTDDGVAVKLLNVDRDLLVIPSVAIHLNRSVNEKFSPNPAQDLIPLLGAGGERIEIQSLIAAELGVNLEIYAVDWESLISGVQAGTYDGIIAGMSPTAQREEQVDFTDCYYNSNLVIIYKK